MSFIRDNYEIIRLKEIGRTLRERTKVARRVVITFDDAAHNFYDNAYPIIARLRVPVTVFVPSGLIGKTNEWDARVKQLPTRPLMTQDQLLSLKRRGLVDFGSHSVTHANMRRLPIDEMKAQALDSKSTLEKLLGYPVTMFAYPYGNFDHFSRRTTEVLYEAGYEVAVTTCWGTQNSARRILTLKRIYFLNSDSETDVKRKIDGGYDWKGIRQKFGYTLRVLGWMPGT